jgi:exodeoxyribonuclease-5
MNLTDDQYNAIKKCVNWYFSTDFNKKNIFVIAGYAGTGKSTIINVLTDILGLQKYNVIQCCYTGKAVNVLRRKGMNANTVHKTFYNIFKGSGGKFCFKLKPKLSSIIKLIVIDEFSMLNDQFIEDILSFGIYTIALGDAGQLPPVFGKNSYIENVENIDVMLTQIMRQTGYSGVLELATKARNSEKIAIGKYGNCNVFHMKDIKSLLDYDIIVCYKNDTRRRINTAIRLIKGIKSIYPVKDEKLICMKTNYFHKLEYEDMDILTINGLTFLALSNTEQEDKLYKLRYKPDYINKDNYYFDTYIDNILFENYINNNKIDIISSSDDSEDNKVQLDFGYAASAWKVQGSEFDRVLVLEENDLPSHLYSRYLYTSITRAKLSVDIVKNFY